MKHLLAGGLLAALVVTGAAPAIADQPANSAAFQAALNYKGPMVATPGYSMPDFADQVAVIEKIDMKPQACVSCDDGVKRAINETRAFRYLAQIADAIVVAAAVRGGSHERIGFGNRPNPLAYMAALGAEDYIVDNAVGPDNRHVQIGLNVVLGGLSLFNALKSH